MRVATWNTADNTIPGRHEERREYLPLLRSDLSCFQEFRFTGQAAGCVRTPPAGIAWGSAVVGEGLRPWPLPASSVLHRFAVRVALAAWETSLGTVAVASVHPPTGPVSEALLAGIDRQRWRRPSGLFHDDLIFYGLAEVAGLADHFLFAGDWMETLLLDARYGGTVCAEFFDRAEAAGWVDATSAFFGVPRLDLRTWYGQRGGRNHVPYQLDRLFVDAGLAARIRNCDVVSHPAQCLGLSDHAPVVVDFDL